MSAPPTLKDTLRIISDGLRYPTVRFARAITIPPDFSSHPLSPFHSLALLLTRRDIPPTRSRKGPPVEPLSCFIIRCYHLCSALFRDVPASSPFSGIIAPSHADLKRSSSVPWCSLPRRRSVPCIPIASPKSGTHCDTHVAPTPADGAILIVRLPHTEVCINWLHIVLRC
jgi:hypothetical protein